MQFKSEEVNYLIYRYLLESGFSHSAFVFSHEALLSPGNITNRGSGNGKSHDDSGFSLSKAADQVPAGALLTLLHKGLQYCDIQLHAAEDGTLRPCGKAVSLLVPHVCSFAAATERQVQPSTQNVLGNQQGQGNSQILLGNQNASPNQIPLPNQNVLPNQIPLPNQQLSNQIADQQTTAQSTTTASIPLVPASSVISLVGHTAEVYTCSWNPAKALLATGSGDSTARIWSLIEPIPSTGCQSILLAATDSTEQATMEDKLIITTLEWNPTGTLLAAGRSDGGCFVWDCEGTLVGHWKKHSASVFSIRWSPSGKWLVSGSEDSTVIVMAVSSGTVEGEKIQIDSASESDQSILAPMQIDSPSNAVNFSFHCSFSDHKGSVLDVDWEDEDTFASCSQDATIRVFSLSSALSPDSLVATLEGHAKEINAIKWSPHSHLLCSCSDDGTAKIWTSSTANTLPLSTTVEEGEVGEDLEKKSPESTNPTLPYSRVRSYALLHTLAGHADGIYTVEWSPNSPSLLATASFDTTARLWNALEGTCIWVLAKHSKPVYSLAFSPDGLTLVTGAVDKNVYFWDTERGKPLLAHPCKGGVYALGWSADGAGVAVCTAKSAAFLAVRASSIAAK